MFNKKTATLVQQTRTKTQKILAVKKTLSKEAFTFRTLFKVEGVESVTGLTCSETYKSFFIITNENKILEMSQHTEKKEKRYSVKTSKIDDENFTPEDPKAELLGPAENTNFEEVECENINIMRKAVPLTEEETESIAISNEAEDSVYDETKME